MDGGYISGGSNTAVEGDRVTVTCYPGYEMEGEEEGACLKSGEWSCDPPICSVVGQFYSSRSPPTVFYY